jgi:hypothetical protein
MYKELERMRKEVFWPIQHWLEEMRKAMKNLRQDRQSPGQDINDNLPNTAEHVKLRCSTSNGMHSCNYSEQFQM